MPFGLKNAGAMYQRLVNKVFESLISKTMEVYVDDIITKSVKEADHVRDLEETFKLLRTYVMKLNPNKCTFAVRLGKFLGYMINQWGIEANPDKIRAILQIRLPRTIKDVQKLTRCIAVLDRFMSRSVDKCLPFFKVLKRKTPFGWDEKVEKAFQRLKEYLEHLP